jgi:RimJ/RimL family protein N-acetyltransferase
MPTPLTTDRLRLREWSPDDVDFVFDAYSRWEVQQYLGDRPRVMVDRAEAAAAIARWQAASGPVLGLWAVELADGGALLGNVLLKDIPASGPTEPMSPSGDIEIGWHFHPDAWGHGYATEAARAVLGHAFDSGIDRVVAVTYPDNVASQRVCRRIGLEYLGSTDRYYNSTLELFETTRPHP